MSWKYNNNAKSLVPSFPSLCMCVCWVRESTNTTWDIIVHYVKIFCTKCEVKDNGDMGIGHLLLKWVGHLWLKWVGQSWQSELLFSGAGLQGSTLSDHCMTTGFGPFEFLTCSLLQKGRTTPCLKPALRSGSMQKYCYTCSSWKY